MELIIEEGEKQFKKEKAKLTKQPPPPPPKNRVNDDIDDDDDKGEEKLHMKIVTCADLLESTITSTERRAARKKVNQARIWKPSGEYTLVRSGYTLTENPDNCVSALQERTLFLFRHNDPETVKFGEDPRTPLWKGVLKIHADLGYKEGEYYDPKQTHFKKIYSQRPKKQKPIDNLVARRDGGESLPYWVDDYYHMKQNEQQHKQSSKKRKLERETEEVATVMKQEQEKSRIAVAASGGGGNAQLLVQAATAASILPPDTSTGDASKGPGGRLKRRRRVAKREMQPPIMETNDKFIFPLCGWMEKKANSKGAPNFPVNHSSMLKSSPATALKNGIVDLVSKMGKVGPNGEILVAVAAAKPVASDAPVKKRQSNPKLEAEKKIEVEKEDKEEEEDEEEDVLDDDDDDDDDEDENDVFEPPKKDTKKAKRSVTFGGTETKIIEKKGEPPVNVVAANNNSTMGNMMLKLKMAKSRYVNGQCDAYSRGDFTHVQPAYNAYLSGKYPVDPDAVLSDFVLYLEKELK